MYTDLSQPIFTGKHTVFIILGKGLVKTVAARAVANATSIANTTLECPCSFWALVGVMLWNNTPFGLKHWFRSLGQTPLLNAQNEQRNSRRNYTADKCCFDSTINAQGTATSWSARRPCQSRNLPGTLSRCFCRFRGHSLRRWLHWTEPIFRSNHPLPPDKKHTRDAAVACQ